MEELLGPLPRRRDLLVEALHRINDAAGCLPEPLLVALAETLQLSVAQVFQVASFYHHFRVVPGLPEQAPVRLRLCNSIACELQGARALLEALKGALGDRLEIETVPCVGRCAGAPVAVLGTRPLEHATVEQVAAALEHGERQAPAPAAPGRDAPYPLYARLAREGDRQAVLQEIEAAGLRGMGGAGFPVARKWQLVRQQPGPRFMVVNIDEGEPGTFKDRHWLEQDPRRCLEGMLIAAWMVEAEAVYLYLRDEYAGCRRMLREALEQLRENPPAALPELHLRRGAGSYVCGEESALIESLEGKRGMPRLRPPYVARQGLFGRPTLVHNLETLYWIPGILQEGARVFAGRGRRGCRGLRSFSVSGRVSRPGVKVAPAGISLLELIDEYCGGMAPGEELYAFFPGGASGGVLPASLASEPLDFDTLQPHGAFLGSAAVMVLSRRDSVKQAVLNALRFLADESCGQCTPCRSGTVQALRLLQQPRPDRKLLKELAEVMRDASICGLGQAAPNPFLCLMNYFPGELEP